MNTRHAIQPSNLPAVLSISFSVSRKRFIVGLSDGCRIFRTDDCSTTCQPDLGGPGAVADGGVGVAAVLDDRYLAYVKGGRNPQGSPHKFMFWDAVLGKQITTFDFHEPIIAVRLATTFAAVTLVERTILFEYQRFAPSQTLSQSEDLATATENVEIGPNKPVSLHNTATNAYGLCILRPELLVLPAQSVGQVQLVPLPAGSKRVFRAHNTQLRALTLSDDGTLIATASVQGTLIRVFDTRSLDQIAEFRRGVDHAIIYSIVISPGNRWVACSSDKGTLHIFDLRPNTPQTSTNAAQLDPIHKKSNSQSIRPGTAPSINSIARSSPPASVQYQGSVQEYYGLLPPPPIPGSPTTQTAATSVLNAFKQSALAPRALKDVRSVVSAPFHMGNEAPHWQGGAAYAWTTGPDGTRRRVNNPVPPLANDTSGRPPKGILAFSSEKTDDNDGALLYSVGGGSDARWERFRLVRSSNTATGNEWLLANEGFRRYLTRQFVE